MEYVKPLAYYGAIIAIIVGFVEIVFAIFSLSFITIILAIIAIVSGFLVFSRYYPLIDKAPRDTAIWLIIFGILSGSAIGGILILIAGLLIVLEKEV
ncbi:MAG: hypothetical protein ACFFAL_00715 [Promethearchaeota archaeon]